MKFTDEHHALYKTVKEFGEKEIKPFNEEWEKAGIYPAKELFKKMADLNLLGITKNPTYGGMGLDYSYSIVFAEALGRNVHIAYVFIGGSFIPRIFKIIIYIYISFS